MKINKIKLENGSTLFGVDTVEDRELLLEKNINIEELEAKALLNTKYQGIENHIYSFYSEKKQSQDTKWADSYTTKLKASGVEDLELKIVNKAKAFFKGDTLEKVLKDVDDTQKPYFKKLVKVAIRTEWAELCVMEGTKAIQEDREPNYPPFPNI